MSILYIVATPIGNLSDITFRAVETLKNVDFIAAEDTRVSKKLLNHFDIQKPMISYYEHNRRERGNLILEKIKAGESCALISDAGTPAISDPGEDLAFICMQSGIQVVPIPGACAAVSALSACGISSGRFCFEGFLSTSKKNRKAHLEDIKDETRTMIFYEAPHKLRATLSDFYSTFGDRNIVLCRELTKIHEQFLAFPLGEAVKYYEEVLPKGEFVIVIEGKKIKLSEQEIEEENQINLENALVLVKNLTKEGKKLKEAVKNVSSQTGIAKNLLYNKALEQKEDNGGENG